MAVLCSNMARASRARFITKEFLADNQSPFEVRTRGSFDWDSIMLYPSWIGAKKDEQGYILPTLLKANGEYMPFNQRPSRGDALAIVELYPK